MLKPPARKLADHDSGGDIVNNAGMDEGDRKALRKPIRDRRGQSVPPRQQRKSRAALVHGDRAPANFPRRILLAVTGLSPQVVTETLYALAVNPGQRPAFVPTEIHIVTTQQGYESARLTLLPSDKPGWFHCLCSDYGLQGIAFSVDNIHILRDADGSDLTDIRTPADNEAAADTITEWVRQFTADPDSALHVSIAGGRKTMGYYAGYALSLYGRAQDRLSHVLVSPPFESLIDFYYPTPDSRVIFSREPKSQPLDARDASVTLAEIPFVSLRHGLPHRLLEGRARFSDSVDAARLTLGAPTLDIDLKGRRLRCSGKIVDLAPTELAFLAWFARRAMQNQKPIIAPPDGAPSLECAEQYLEEYRKILGPMGGDERKQERLKNGMDKQTFMETKSKLSKLLRNALGTAAQAFLPKTIGKRLSGYALPLPATAIRFSVIEPR